MTTERPPVTLDHMRQLIRKYFDGCNEADLDKMTSCFTADATHYFPPDMYNGPFRGSKTIADRWAEAVATVGSCWTIDSFVGDASTGVAVIEWTHFKQFKNTVLRGDEWYQFDLDTGLIREIRAYYASPQDTKLSRLELGGFDYETRGYAMTPPAEHVHQA